MQSRIEIWQAFRSGTPYLNRTSLPVPADVRSWLDVRHGLAKTWLNDMANSGLPIGIMRIDGAYRKYPEGLVLYPLKTGFRADHSSHRPMRHY